MWTLATNELITFLQSAKKTDLFLIKENLLEKRKYYLDTDLLPCFSYLFECLMSKYFKGAGEE